MQARTYPYAQLHIYTFIHTNTHMCINMLKHNGHERVTEEFKCVRPVSCRTHKLTICTKQQQQTTCLRLNIYTHTFQHIRRARNEIEIRLENIKQKHKQIFLENKKNTTTTAISIH